MGKRFDDSAVRIVQGCRNYLDAAKELNRAGYVRGDGQPFQNYDISYEMIKRGYRKSKRHAAPTKTATHKEDLSTRVIEDATEVLTSNLSPRMKTLLLKQLVTE